MSPLIFCPMLADVFELPRMLLLLGVVGLLVPELIRRPHPETLRDPLCLGVALFLFSALVSTLASPSPWMSFLGVHESDFGLSTLIGYGGLFAVTRTLVQTTDQARRLLCTTVLGTAFTVVLAILQVFRYDPFPWAGVSSVAGFVRPFGGLGHANLLGAFLVMALPMVGYWTLLAWRQKHARAAMCLLVLLGGGALVLVLTLSRGAWLGAAGVVGCLGLLGGGKTLWRFRRLGLAWILLLALGLSWVFLSQADVLPGLAARLRHPGEMAGRWEIWRVGVALAAERPLVGCGPDLFASAFGAFRTEEQWRLEWNGTPHRAHNDVLHILATQGLLGGAALILIVVGLGIHAWRAWRQGADKMLIGCLIAALFGFLIQGLFNFVTLGFGTLAVTLTALLSPLGRCPPEEREPRPFPGLVPGFLLALVVLGYAGLSNIAPWGSVIVWWLALVCGGLVFVWTLRPLGEAGARFGIPRMSVGHALGLLVWLGILGWSVATPFTADLSCRRGDETLVEAPEVALAHYEEATRQSPHREFYWRRQAGALQTLALKQPPGSERNRLLHAADSAANEALRLGPSHPPAYALRARILVMLALEREITGDKAVQAMEEAVRWDPNNAVLHGDVGFAHLNMGRWEEARRHFARGLILEPRSSRHHAGLGALAAAQQHWDEAARCFEEAARGEWHGDHAERHYALGAEALTYLALGRLDQAEEAANLAASTGTPSALLLRARVREVRGQTMAATRDYQEALARDPGNLVAQRGLARLAGKEEVSPR